MLSPDDRAVLEQVELAGTSQAQMATEADVPASTIKSRVQRARLRLREHFERCCAIELDARGNPREFTSRGSPDYPRCAACDGETTEKQPGCS
jgi:RNA polymerase sigma-70 factor (ECF subfamily)